MSLLEVRGVSKRFGGLQALSEVNFDVAPGQIVGLIGPNGAGKSTLINAITGVHPPDAGSIRLGGRELAGLAPDRITRLGVGRTFQVPLPFASLTCADNVAVGVLFGGGAASPGHSASPGRARSLDAARAQARIILDFVGLGGKAGAAPQSLTIVDLRKLELARALAAGARLLLLDEIITGLTAAEITEAIALIEQVRRRGTAILLVEHLVRVIMAVCERVVVLDFGRKIADGAPDEIARHPEVIRAYLGGEREGGSARR